MKDKLEKRAECKNKMKESFKSIDLFGQHISLTWNGEDEYKTTIGATLSSAIWIVMITYTIIRFSGMVSRNNPQISKYSLIRLPEEDLSFSPQESGFDFSFGLSQKLDPSIAYFTVSFVN